MSNVGNISVDRQLIHWLLQYYTAVSSGMAHVGAKRAATEACAGYQPTPKTIHEHLYFTGNETPTGVRVASNDNTRTSG